MVFNKSVGHVISGHEAPRVTLSRFHRWSPRLYVLDRQEVLQAFLLAPLNNQPCIVAAVFGNLFFLLWLILSTALLTIRLTP